MGENFLCSFFSLLKILKSFAIKECDRQLKYQLLFMTYFIEREREDVIQQALSFNCKLVGGECDGLLKQ